MERTIHFPELGGFPVEDVSLAEAQRARPTWAGHLWGDLPGSHRPEAT